MIYSSLELSPNHLNIKTILSLLAAQKQAVEVQLGVRLWAGQKPIAMIETQSLWSQAHCPLREQTRQQAENGWWGEEEGF